MVSVGVRTHVPISPPTSASAATTAQRSPWRDRGSLRSRAGGGVGLSGKDFVSTHEGLGSVGSGIAVNVVGDPTIKTHDAIDGKDEPEVRLGGRVRPCRRISQQGADQTGDRRPEAGENRSKYRLVPSTTWHSYLEHDSN